MKTLFACAFGASVAFAGTAGAASLTTTFAGGNGASGNFFDVGIGSNALTLTEIDLNLSLTTNTDLFFYYRTGSYSGNTGSSTGWTEHETATVTGAGSGNPTNWNIADLVLDASTTYGFFIGAVAGGVNYTNGTSEGALYVSNADLSIFEGRGSDGSFGGSTFVPRVWNGTLTYDVGTTAAVPLPAGAILLISALGAAGLMRRQKD